MPLLLLTFHIEVWGDVEREFRKSSRVRSEEYIIDINIRFPIYSVEVEHRPHPFLGLGLERCAVPQVLIWLKDSSDS